MILRKTFSLKKNFNIPKGIISQSQQELKLDFFPFNFKLYFPLKSIFKRLTIKIKNV